MIIKKKVSLDFLGDDYKDAELVFKSIPVLEFDGIQKKLKEIEGKDDASNLNYIVTLLIDHFLYGKFPNDKGELVDVEKEELKDLDSQTLLECFKVFTGQDVDPKVQAPEPTQSQTPSSTDQDTPS